MRDLKMLQFSLMPLTTKGCGDLLMQTRHIYFDKCNSGPQQWQLAEDKEEFLQEEQ